MSKQASEQTNNLKASKLAVRLNLTETIIPTNKINVSLKPIRSFRGQRSMRPSAMMPSAAGLKSKS